jgi:hypothetical protein
LKKQREELRQLGPQRDILEVKISGLERVITENEAKYGLLERSKVAKGMKAVRMCVCVRTTSTIGTIPTDNDSNCCSARTTTILFARKY